jgi:hypothetical protein
MLNVVQIDLYRRLQDFELDDPTHEFGFTRHLMKSQGWTLTYAQRAIAEYKKFAFLAVVADHQVVPSDQVDQVWHSHVLLTDSYWEEFCPQVLGRKLHHHPARGGRTERAEFHQLYAQTIISYRHFFGSPPTDVWSPPDLRFGAELKMQRVNLSDNWVIPKLPFLRLLARLVGIIGFATMITLLAISHVDAVAKDALNTDRNLISDQAVTIAVFLLPIILGLMLRFVIRLPLKQSHKPELDIYQIAYLAGGYQRAIELAIVQLVHAGCLSISVRYRSFSIKKSLLVEPTPLQQQVMQQVHLTPELKDLRGAEKYQPDLFQQQLQQKRLLMQGWPLLIGSSWSILISITVLGAFLLGNCST